MFSHFLFLFFFKLEEIRQPKNMMTDSDDLPELIESSEDDTDDSEPKDCMLIFF